jgi:hypothetical protein
MTEAAAPSLASACSNGKGCVWIRVVQASGERNGTRVAAAATIASAMPAVVMSGVLTMIPIATCSCSPPVVSDSGLSVGWMEHNGETQRRIRLTARGPKAAIEIDGQRVDPGILSGYTISHQEGESPHVVLYAQGDDETCFEGLARVSVADAPDPGPAAAVFLSAIDAGELERAALDRPDLGTGPHSLTQAMLTQLREWAHGL